MSRATENLRNVSVFTPIEYGNTIISCTDWCACNPDFFWRTNLDPISIRAILRSRQLDISDIQVAAGKDGNMGILAVDWSYVLQFPISDEFKP